MIITSRAHPTSIVRNRPACANVDIVIPVYNEEAVLERSIRCLHAYVGRQVASHGRIVIADNASTDGTWPIARRLARELSHVDAIHLDRKGRGRALRTAWLHSDADIVAYMDVDLSTDLAQMGPLISEITDGGADVVIGSRLSRQSDVVRGIRREVISRIYNRILHVTLGVGFPDAQCGFKAMRADVARRLLPDVFDDAWFFDTELLVRAERADLTIAAVPVRWVEDSDSRVRIVRTAVEDLRGIVRLLRDPALPRRRRAPRRLLRFAAIGTLSTLAYTVLYAGLRNGMPAQAANALALIATTVGNTAANRRFTFGACGGRRLVQAQAGGFVALGAALTITTGALAGLSAVVTRPTLGVEVAVLLAANVASMIARFAILRRFLPPPAA
jgi:glycosyltransferase involved in cell wall biosynthesis